MSSLTRCTVPRRAMPRVLPAPALLQILLILAALLGFGLAHLQLRFSLNDMQGETIRLQSLKSALQSDINALKGRTESLKQPERLMEYAQAELGMQHYSPGDRESLPMPDSIHSRYAMARASGLSARDDAEFATTHRVWLQALSDGIGMIGQAVAAEKFDAKD